MPEINGRAPRNERSDALAGKREILLQPVLIGKQLYVPRKMGNLHTSATHYLFDGPIDGSTGSMTEAGSLSAWAPNSV